MNRLTVVFDLDGTLIDTAPDLIRATNHVLRGAGYQAVAPDYIRPFISFGTRRMIEEGVRYQGATISQSQLDQLFTKLLAFYSQNMTVESTPFPGLVGVLDGLRARDAIIAICTNKREDMAKLLMQQLDLAHYFAVITGRDTFPVCKPDPAHLLGAINMAGGHAARTVMVGDSTTDYATAKAASVPIIGVTFGYTDVPVVDLDCEAVISDYAQFFDALERVAPA